MKQIFFFALCLLASPNFGYTQSIGVNVISTGGASFTTNTAQVSWTMGETVTNTFSTNNSVLTSGFQQPNLIESQVDATPSLANDEQIKIFNNNETDKLIITSDIPIRSEDYILNVYDMLGKKVIQHKSKNLSMQLSIHGLPRGVYLIEIIDSNKNLIKHQKINH